MAQKPKSRRRRATAIRSGGATVGVDVLKAQEEWSELELSDGTTIRMKPIVAEVQRHKRNFTADGDPIYNIKTTMIVVVKAPARLKKKAPARLKKKSRTR